MNVLVKKFEGGKKNGKEKKVLGNVFKKKRKYMKAYMSK